MGHLHCIAYGWKIRKMRIKHSLPVKILRGNTRDLEFPPGPTPTEGLSPAAELPTPPPYSAAS